MIRPLPWSTVLLAVVVGITWPLPAWANQPPGPQMLLAEVALLPLMALLSWLSGLGPAAKAAKEPSAIVYVAITLACLFLSALHEGFSAGVVVILAIIALRRGFYLVRRGRGKTEGAATRPGKRATAAGLAIIVATVGLVGMNWAFVGWWPGERRVEADLRQFVAYQLAHGQKRQQSGGQKRFAVPLGNRPLRFGVASFPHLVQGDDQADWRGYVTEFRLAPNHRSFQVWATPRRMPLFPYNLLITLPSFYADQTGELRQIRVHWAGVRCPEDAPVFARVEDTAVKAMADRLKAADGTSTGP